MKMGSFLEHFSVIPDPMSTINRKHLLIDILFTTVCAVICGAKGWDEIAEFGKCRHDWLKRFIELPNGIPSHDTFRDVFLFLDTKKFNESFGSWILDIAKKIPGEIISIDGKTSRRSSARNSKPLHLVSAWASKNSLVLSQVKVDEESNEITAIPEILSVLDTHGCIVTIDAMGCQKEIAEKIIFQENQCRKRIEKSAVNFAIMRHIALNLLKKEQTYKGSIIRKQFKAALTEEYLEKVLQCETK